MAESLTVRDHARAAIRDEVMKQAWLLFAQQGFDATTVDEIAEAAGMSRRTFFRYFDGKDELVLDRLVSSGTEVATALAARPPSEGAWQALRRAFDDSVATQEQHADVARPLQRMLREEPGVRASVLEWRRRWQQMLAPLVAERLRSEGAARRAPDVRAEALVASALACLETAQGAWGAHPGRRLSTLLDDAMGAVSPL